jgi:hypothetical protein
MNLNEEQKHEQFHAKWGKDTKLVQFFSGDTLLFEKQRNDRFVNEFDGFVAKFFDNKENDRDPFIFFNEEHGFITVLNIKGETLFKYDTGHGFITDVSVEGDYLVLVGWAWHPVFYVSVIPIENFFKNENAEEHRLFSEPNFNAMGHFDWTSTHLIFTKVDGTEERIPWRKIHEEKLEFVFTCDNNSSKITEIKMITREDDPVSISSLAATQ